MVAVSAASTSKQLPWPSEESVVVAGSGVTVKLSMTGAVLAMTTAEAGLSCGIGAIRGSDGDGDAVAFDKVAAVKCVGYCAA